MTLHPTKEEALEMISNDECGCYYARNNCFSCLANDKSTIRMFVPCLNISNKTRLTMLAFVITMPADIRRSLENEKV